MPKIQKNQSDRVDEQAVLEMVKSGKTDKEISEALGVSIRSIIRIRTAHNIRRPRGGARPGAGRKRTRTVDVTSVTIEELRRQQAIDMKVNSLEVGIGRKVLTHKDIWRWVSSAYVPDGNGRYIRVKPCNLPRVLAPYPAPALEVNGSKRIYTARAWDAARGGSK